MSEKRTEFLKQIGVLVVLGAAVMVGVRAIEWVIPEPPTRIIVCMSDEVGKVEVCKSLKDLRIASEGVAK